MTPKEIAAAEQSAFEAEQAQVRSGQHNVVNGIAVPLTPTEVAEFNDREAAATAAVLPNAKAAAVERVNSDCGAYRATIGTDIPFQSTVYADKRDEVARFQADPAPDPAKYPYIFLEAKDTGMTVADKVKEIATLSAQWTMVSAVVEAKRRGAIVAIQNAQSVEEVAKLIPVWP